ncbi:MAG: PAS domain S-box protein [Ignavibacteria bacterium]
MPVSKYSHSLSNSVVDSIHIFLKSNPVWQLERKRIWLALALLTSGLILTTIASLSFKTAIEQNSRKEFNLVCNELKNKISARMHTHTQLLRSGAAFFAHSDGITRNEWRNFYKNQMIEQNIPGIQGVGYSIIIPRNQLALHEKKIQHEGFPQYSVRPAGRREIYTSVIYLEPFSGRNMRAFGYDMFSEPVRRKAMETARDFNIVALSGEITLIQELTENIHGGALMYAPVYKEGIPVSTVEERRRAIKGWVYSPYRMNDLMSGIFGGYEIIKEKHIRLEIFNNSSYNRDRILYDSEAANDMKIISSSLLFSLIVPVFFNDDQWYLRFTEYESGTSGLDYSKVWFTVAGGTSISILLFVVYLLLINTNVRAYKLAEELTRDLSKSETKHSSMIFNISDVVCIIDTDGIFTYISPNVEKWFGWQPQDLLGTDGWLTVHPDDLEHVQKKIFSLLENDNSLKVVEYNSKCKDGSYKPIHLTAVNLINDPVINGILTNYHDITERRQSEKILHETNAYLENLINYANAPIIVWDPQFRITRFNHAFEFLTGRSEKEVIGQSLTLLFPPDLSENSMVLIHKTLMGEHWRTVEIKILHRDNSIKTVLWNSATLFAADSHTPIATIAQGQDITERKQAEEALQLRESYLSAIIENQSGLFWLKDSEGRILVVNKKFLDIFGLDKPEMIIGKTDIDLWHHELANRYIADDIRVIKTKKTIIVEELVSDKGDVKWFETYKSPIFDNQGVVIGTTGYSIDITERKMAQLELLKVNEDLRISKMCIEENLIQEHALVEEVTKTKEKLEKINAEKDKFFSIIAHDLRSPFQGLLVITKSMAENINSFSQTELSNVAREMYITSKNVFTLLNNLLEWARMQQGMISFNPKEILLSDIVSENINLIIKRGEQKEIEIINEAARNQTVNADEAMLNTILRNLLSNAVKFTKQGGKVSINSKVTENNMVEISVTDSGIGMPEALAQKLFKVAEKVGRKGTNGESSTGLGLLLCKEFTEKHGGKIWVKSENGKGSTFYFTLPAVNDNSMHIMKYLSSATG